MQHARMYFSLDIETCDQDTFLFTQNIIQHENVTLFATPWALLLNPLLFCTDTTRMDRCPPI
jgi:hypothetical protein